MPQREAGCWAERSAFPGGFNGPWDVEAVTAWRASALAGGSALQGGVELRDVDLNGLLDGVPDGERTLLGRAIRDSAGNPKALAETLYKIERNRMVRLQRQAIEREFVERDLFD